MASRHRQLGSRTGKVSTHLASPMIAVLLWTLLDPTAMAARPKKKAPPTAQSADDLMIVDCLLPNKVRRLGRRNTHMLPRQPIRTAAADCRIRGGEYTEADQANYRTSLEVWLPQAKAGDAEAQYYVGQIFEKGLGTTADYQSAAEWYRKAADQKYAAAQTSLGYLYEEGLGVERDDVAALNWYRQAAGLAEDLVVLEQADYSALIDARAELEAQRGEVESLESEVEELRQQLEESKNRAHDDDEKQALLQSILKRLRASLAERQQELAEGQARISRLESDLGSSTTAAGASEDVSLEDLPFGSYHALVIGNAGYQSLPRLDQAAADARLVAELLEKKYGFEVQLLIDADRFQIMNALNDLRESLTQDDNLLVYYAGHGLRDEGGHTAYWQPVDAEARNPANWIPNEVVTEHLDLMAARHVFVVADSVYSGLRTRSSIARLRRGMTPQERHYHIKLLLEKRSRLVLASGLQGSRTEDGGSRFASTFLEVLRENDDVLEASSLYSQVNERLVTGGEGGAQPVEFATMRWARNDLAEFFLVPKG